MPSTSNSPSSTPFKSKVAIARHFGVNIRTVHSWTYRPSWPAQPTPANVSTFLHRIKSPAAPAATAHHLDRLMAVFAELRGMVAERKANANDPHAAEFRQWLAEACEDLRSMAQAVEGRE